MYSIGHNIALFPIVVAAGSLYSLERTHIHQRLYKYPREIRAKTHRTTSHITTIQRNRTTSPAPVLAPRMALPKKSTTTPEEVLLYVPNIIGYSRVLFTIGSLVLMLTMPKYWVLSTALYVASFVGDLFGTSINRALEPFHCCISLQFSHLCTYFNKCCRWISGTKA